MDPQEITLHSLELRDEGMSRLAPACASITVVGLNADFHFGASASGARPRVILSIPLTVTSSGDPRLLSLKTVAPSHLHDL
jgi:hypothetical protein